MDREFGLGGITGRLGLGTLDGVIVSFFLDRLGDALKDSELLEFLLEYTSLEFLGELDEFLLDVGLDKPEFVLLALFLSWTHFSKSSWLTLMGMREEEESFTKSKEFLGLIAGLGVLSLLTEFRGLEYLKVVEY